MVIEEKIGIAGDPRVTLLLHFVGQSFLSQSHFEALLVRLNVACSDEEQLPSARSIVLKHDEHRLVVTRLLRYQTPVADSTAQVAATFFECLERCGDRLPTGKLAFAAQLWRTTLARAAVQNGQLPKTRADDVVWEGFLNRPEEPQIDLLRCSFWRPLENRENPWILILSKVTPLRCQIREAGDTVLDWLKLSPAFATSFGKWLECSLLGLYEFLFTHSSTVCGLSLTRLMEYYEFMQTQTHRTLFHTLLLRQQELRCIFAARERLVYLVSKRPALLEGIRKNTGKTDWWPKFVDICVRLSKRLCELINQGGWSTLLPSLNLFASTSAPQHMDLILAYWQDLAARQEDDLLPRTPLALARRLQAFATTTLTAAAVKVAAPGSQAGQKPKEGIAKRKRRRKRQRLETAENAAAIAASKEKGQDIQACLDSQREMQGIFYHRAQTGFFSLLYSSRNKVPPNTHQPYPGVSTSDLNEHGITHDHFQQLSDWVDRLPSGCTETQALDLLSAFGAAAVGINVLHKLKHDHAHQHGKKTIVNGLLHFAIRYPYTNALAHTLAFLFLRHQTFRIFKLPHHYVVAQLEAIRGKWGLKPDDPIPLDACWLKICRVCNHVFSIVNTDQQIYRAIDTFGWKYVCGHLATGDEYCSRTKVIAHAHNKETLLSKAWIFGNAVCLQNRIYLMCPGPKCGIPFVLSTRSRYITGKGYVCSACSADDVSSSAPIGFSAVPGGKKTKRQKKPKKPAKRLTVPSARARRLVSTGTAAKLKLTNLLPTLASS